MRLILCGKNNAVSHCLEYLVDRGDDVWAIGTMGDEGEDGWQKSFKSTAIRLDVKYNCPRRINSKSMIESLTAFKPDALISIQYDQILKDRLFRSIGCPCLNLHFALLPRHRGVAPIAWAILEGDREAGVTLHHMIERIDAGDLVAQKKVPIGSDMSARELYDCITNASIELFKQCYPFSDDVLQSCSPQNDLVSCYHRSGDFDFSNRRVDWSLDGSYLQRWIRAMIFPPKQYPETAWNGHVLSIARVGTEVGGAFDESAGVIVEKTLNWLRVVVHDGSVRIQINPDGKGTEQQICVGDRLS